MRKAYIISANEMCRPQLLFWLEDHGFDRHRDITFIHESRGICLSKSAAIEQAIRDNVDMAVFCENDALPSAKQTDPFFFENRYHVQCVKYDTEGAHSFDRFDCFHTLIWRASAKSLRSIERAAVESRSPFFAEQISGTGGTVNACSCTHFAKLAKKAGLSTGWIGVAGHAPRQKSIVPRIVTYGR